MNLQQLKISMIGAGNLATRLARALHESGCSIIQVFSRTMRSAELLAKQVEAQPICNTEEVDNRADVLIFALADKVLPDIIPLVAARNPKALMAHTAGSMPMQVFATMPKDTASSIPCRLFLNIERSTSNRFLSSSRHPTARDSRCSKPWRGCSAKKCTRPIRNSVKDCIWRLSLPTISPTIAMRCHSSCSSSMTCPSRSYCRSLMRRPLKCTIWLRSKRRQDRPYGSTKM